MWYDVFILFSMFICRSCLWSEFWRCTSHLEMSFNRAFLLAAHVAMVTAGNLRGNETNQTNQILSASGYWDGQCGPCPAYLYPSQHCKNGGRPQPGISGSRPCPRNPAFCMAKCVGATTPNKPTGGNRPGKPNNPQKPDTYVDGTCRPCPAYLYRHCGNGGKLVGAKPCGWMNIYCEGICTNPEPTKPTEPSKPFEPVVSEPGIKTLYHETSPEAATKILASAFRPGNSGWCGSAIYFYTKPVIPDTKLGPDSQRGAIIQAEVDLGSNIQLDSKCEGADEARGKYDSVSFDPGDGLEYLVFSADRIISMTRYSWFPLEKILMCLPAMDRLEKSMWPQKPWRGITVSLIFHCPGLCKCIRTAQTQHRVVIDDWQIKFALLEIAHWRLPAISV